MTRIVSVRPDSIAGELRIEPGTIVISVDGRTVHDFLDWEFLTAEDQFVMLVRQPDGAEVEFDIERSPDAPMGIELEPPSIRRCGNRCDFCFVDGLPEGLRDTLYVRDDDYRLSFRHGNFATLTNLKSFDVHRILEYRLSPLYVSVHATDPVMRRRLLRNPRAPDIIEQLSMFAAGGIVFHTQIVLQPGVNDGEILKKSLSDLNALGDAVLSVSVVPIGLTEFSKHQLARSPTRDECRDIVDLVHGFSERMLSERGERWVMGADELYLMAELPLPPSEWYGGFEQVENGVGSVRYLQDRIHQAGSAMRAVTQRRFGVVTGTAMRPLMDQVLPKLETLTGSSFEMVPVTNTVFGPRVTTAGLLPGQAMISAMQAAEHVDAWLLPAESLNDQDLFIDDVPFDRLVNAVRQPVFASYDFADVLTGVAA